MPDSATSAEKVVLHVGCGKWRPDALAAPYRKPGWREIRLDIDPEVKPDIIGSMTDMAEIETGTLDAVWTSHSLEHLYAHEVPTALAEFHRVLRSGGHVLVRVPNVEKVAELILRIGLTGVAYRSASGPITPLDMLYGHGGSISSGGAAMQHRTGFTADSLRSLLTESGFTEVRVHRKDYDLWARASR